MLPNRSISKCCPGSTTGANVTGTGSVTTTINDTVDPNGPNTPPNFDTATWAITGDTSVNEGATASYTVSLGGVLQTGETATITLALADLSTTSADYASFTAAVTAAAHG